MRKRCILLGMLFLIPMQLMAGEDHIVTLGTNHVPPFKIIEGDTLRGINADVLEEIFQGTQLKIEIVNCPWKRCLEELKKGNIDVFLGIFKSPEREKWFYYCEPPYKERSDKAFYLRKGQGHRVQSYEDLYQFKIGVTRGYKNFERFDSDDKLDKEFVTDHIQNIKKLANGRIDVFVQTEVAADYAIKMNGCGDKIEKARYKYEKIHPSYFIVSRKSPVMNRVEEFERNLSRFHKAGKYDEIRKKWTQ